MQTADGSGLTLATDGAVQLLDNVAAGDGLEVTYIQSGSTTIALAVTITATPTPSTPDGSTNTDPSGPGYGS